MRGRWECVGGGVKGGQEEGWEEKLWLEHKKKFLKKGEHIFK